MKILDIQLIKKNKKNVFHIKEQDVFTENFKLIFLLNMVKNGLSFYSIQSEYDKLKIHNKDYLDIFFIENGKNETENIASMIMKYTHDIPEATKFILRNKELIYPKEKILPLLFSKKNIETNQLFNNLNNFHLLNSISLEDFNLMEKNNPLQWNLIFSCDFDLIEMAINKKIKFNISSVINNKEILYLDFINGIKEIENPKFLKCKNLIIDKIIQEQKEEILNNIKNDVIIKPLIKNRI